MRMGGWKKRGEIGGTTVQNNKSDGCTSVASRIAAVAIQDSEAVVSWGGEGGCRGARWRVDLGCGDCLCEPDMGGQDPGSYGWPQYPRTAAEEQR